MTYSHYHVYMQSPAWRRKRLRYWKSKYPKNCYVCGRQRFKGMHLHHITYERLGRERLSDLVPACPPCHQFIHEYHKGGDLTLLEATKKCKNALKGKNPRQK